jgi:hypothetical protein
MLCIKALYSTPELSYVLRYYRVHAGIVSVWAGYEHTFISMGSTHTQPVKSCTSIAFYPQIYTHILPIYTYMRI